MGWVPFEWFRHTPDKRIAAARTLLRRGEYNEARLEVEGLEQPEAKEILAEALDALVELNLLEWRSQTNAGHAREAGEALSRARRFGASKERIEAFQSSPDTQMLSASHWLPRPRR